MTVYIVIQEGVYRHAIGGVYHTQAAAEARAREMAQAESDNYHDYVVYATELGKPGEAISGDWYPVFGTKEREP